MVTVEAAVALSALVAVLLMGVGAVIAVVDQVRCVDAAREVARLAARGEQYRAGQAVSRIGPHGARWKLSGSGEEIVVEVSAPAARGLLPGIDVHGVAYAIGEVGT